MTPNPAKHSDPDGAAIAPHTLATAEPMSPITPEAVEADLQLMAATCSVDMVLWDRFSNGVLSLLSTLQAVRGENERLREALGNLEQACDDVAAGRSQAAYLMMLDDGQKDALLALDEARRAARQALSTIQNGGGEGGDYPTNLSPASRSPTHRSTGEE